MSEEETDQINTRTLLAAGMRYTQGGSEPGGPWPASGVHRLPLAGGEQTVGAGAGAGDQGGGSCEVQEAEDGAGPVEEQKSLDSEQIL